MSSVRKPLRLPKKGLLSIDDLSDQDILHFLEASVSVSPATSPIPAIRPQGALCFLEASSRTKLSFQSAGQRLGISWLDFIPEHSSLQKGESLRESFQLLKAYGASFFVVRHAQTGLPALVHEWTELPVINAGDGAHEHPTQALGDFVSLRRRFGERPIKVALYGDVHRSRVARSFVKLLKRFSHEVMVTDDQREETKAFAKAFELPLLTSAELNRMNVVYALRTQKERGGKSALGPLSRSHLGEEACWMHAGPVIEGEDLHYELCDFKDPRSLVRDQVKDCFLVRGLLLQALCREEAA